jgi:hypothetical protein
MTGPLTKPESRCIDQQISGRTGFLDSAVPSICPKSEQTSSTKKDKKGMQVKHGISGSNKFVIKRLEEQLRSKQQRCEEAERVNRELRAKEQVWPL